jgi:hypothetical protein
LRDPEQRLLREPELDDEACAGSAEPPEGRGDAIEVGAEGLEGLCCGMWSVDMFAIWLRTNLILTILVVLSLLLVVLATQLGPLRKVVLRRSVGHLTVELDDFLAQSDTGSGLLGLWRRKICVEEP